MAYGSVTTGHIAQWGARQVSGASSLGVITSFEQIEDVMTQNETSEDGSVCRVVPYDTRRRIVFCVQASSSTAQPMTGENITVDGQSGWVVHAETVESNTSFKKIRVTVESYKNCDTIDNFA